MFNPALFGLLAKKPADLTESDLVAILTTFKINTPVTPELRGAALALLQDHHIDVVSDMFTSPKAVGDLLALVGVATKDQAPEDDDQGCEVVRCKHCKAFFIHRFN